MKEVAKVKNLVTSPEKLGSEALQYLHSGVFLYFGGLLRGALVSRRTLLWTPRVDPGVADLMSENGSL